MKKVVVIGSGFGGLASAIRLRTSGYDVELIEARDKPGGRAYVYEQDGFTFDAGPTVITAPFLLDEIFEGAGRRTADYVKIVPDPFYRIEFHDGRFFEYNGDEVETERRIAAFAPGDLAGYRQMIRAAHGIFQKGFVALADRPFLRFSDMIRIAPDSFALYFTGVSAERVNSARSKEALANGQCILFRREAYDAIGGHASVQTSVIEDVALAAIAKRKGIRVRVVRAEHLGSVRMYDSFRAIWQGFNKNSFHFLRVNPWTGVQVVTASILLTSWLPALLMLAHEGRWEPAVLFATLPMLFTAGWYGGLRASLSAPIAIYAFQAIALDGMFRAIFKRNVIWKGRHV